MSSRLIYLTTRWTGSGQRVQYVHRRHVGRKKAIRLSVSIPVVTTGGVKREKKKVTLTKNMINKTVQGVIDDSILHHAVKRPDSHADRPKTNRLSKDDVSKILKNGTRLDNQGGHFVDQPPPPTGRIWKGERWRLRDASGVGLYDLGAVTSLSYEECWERRRGYWWDGYEERW
ncbi:hypothetical protein GWN75_10605, partial [candidate division KSB1 bacterium]|nr:hypothetical protein [candidate division KSB1 bacterium]